MTWNISRYTLEAMRMALTSGPPIIFVETWEEERLEHILTTLGRGEIGLPVWTWSSSCGFHGGPGADQGFEDMSSAMAFVAKTDQAAIWLFRDLPAHADRREVKRALRDLYDLFGSRTGQLVGCFPVFEIPDDLRKEIYYLRLPLPDREEIASLLHNLNENLSPDDQFAPDWLANCAADMKSFTSNECRDLFRSLSASKIADLAQAQDRIRDAASPDSGEGELLASDQVRSRSRQSGRAGQSKAVDHLSAPVVWA